MSTQSSSITESSLKQALHWQAAEGSESSIVYQLPEEILKKIFEWFDWKNLAICRSVCVRFRANIDRSFSFELERLKHMVKCVEKSSTDSEALNFCKSNVLGMVEKPEEAIELLKTISNGFWFFSSLCSIVERFAPKSQVDMEGLLDLFFDKKALMTPFESKLERFLKEIFPYIDFSKSLKILEKIKAYRELAKNFVLKIIEQKISFVELEKLVKALDPNDPNRDQNIKEIIERKINSLELDQALQLFRSILDKDCAFWTLIFICKQKVNTASAGKEVIAAMCAANLKSELSNSIRDQVLESTVSAIDFDLNFAFQIIDKFEDGLHLCRSFKLLAEKAKTKEELFQILEKILKLNFWIDFHFIGALKVAPNSFLSMEIFDLAKGKIEVLQNLFEIWRILMRRCPDSEKNVVLMKRNLNYLIEKSTDESRETIDGLFYEMGCLELSTDRKKALENALNIKDEKLRIRLLLEILRTSYEAKEEIEKIINALMEIKDIELWGEGFLEILGTIASKEPERAIEIVEKMFKDVSHLASVMLSLSEKFKSKEKSSLFLQKAKRAIEKITDPAIKLRLLIKHYEIGSLNC